MKQSKTLSKIGMGIVCAAMMVGCYKHSYTVGAGGNTEKEAAYSKWHAHWLFGLIGEDDVDVKAICPSGDATVKDSHTFVNSLIHALVGTIYAPTTVEVYCGDAPAKAATLSPSQMRAAALQPEAMEMARRISSAKAAELQAAVEAFREANKNVASTGAATRF